MAAKKKGLTAYERRAVKRMVIRELKDTSRLWVDFTSGAEVEAEARRLFAVAIKAVRKVKSQ